MCVENFATCLGLVTPRATLVGVASIHVFLAIVFCVDVVKPCLFFTTVGDLLNAVIREANQEKSLECYPVLPVLPQAIFLSLSLVFLLGAFLNEARCLYLFLVYTISRISVALFTGYMLVCCYHSSNTLIEAISPWFLFVFFLSLAGQIFTVALTRWCIIDMVKRRLNPRLHVIKCSCSHKSADQPFTETMETLV